MNDCGSAKPRATLTVREAAAALGISLAGTYEAIRAGRIPSLQFGRRIVIPRAPFERMLGTGESQ